MLADLRLTDFRNYREAEIAPSSGLNIILGDNGSGKTSLLEAIYFIGSGGRSFRGGRLSRLVRDGAEAATLFARVDHGEHQHRLGIRRAPSGIESLKLNGATPGALSDVAVLLPVLALHPQSVDLVFGPSALRRRFLDWGMFHVEHSFLATWKEANAALKQRNALLRSGRVSPRELRYWDQKLAASSGSIEQLRSGYLARLKARWQSVLAMLAPELKGGLVLQTGLRDGESYLDALARTRDEDLRRGFTHTGFHRSELKMTVGGTLARDRVSRGQAKILAYGLVLAQLPLIEEAGKICTLLVDDLGSELDHEHRMTLLRFLAAGSHQTLITAVDRNQLAPAVDEKTGAAARLFHVEHGRVQRISDDP
ncbi:DNA replication and repair protein RecF [Alcanivorax sp. 521-1]|uniref:DNA replication and repair protein RecF n=1 Tax=Alloalcanivorax profundimaris TaxID=2735259 RepID=A0ABS0ALI5_9GAMM|nr:DNA replication/repair protein RecF [Alloalcanivorax profundimaris]MBF5054988.1 DNA replication and repair protein RecF [Alloalcanivorax profundimaris]